VKILIASDHAGVELKSKVIEALRFQNTVEVVDYGPNSTESVDYPDFANLICQQLKTDEDTPALKEFGILICGSGQGMAIRANRYKNIRAALVYNNEIAALSREHNNANIICIGARSASADEAIQWINTFKETAFAQGRHQTRVAKLGNPTA
jgi:ribose 5-phosphate isomerase B